MADNKGVIEMSQPAGEHFPFMKLPPEIRLEIYRICLKRRLKIRLEERNKGESKIRYFVRYFNHVIGDPEKACQAHLRGTSDPIIINILRVSKLVHAEAHDVLYGSNTFLMLSYTARNSFDARSCTQFRHLEVVIPTWQHLVFEFWYLLRDRLAQFSSLTHIFIWIMFEFDSEFLLWNYVKDVKALRYLPQTCKISLRGMHNPCVSMLVEEHMALAKSIDNVEYRRLQRQLAHELF